ncbi:MAG: hypothetical protein IJT34_09325 [Butyrivibrio sp.]|nr:hypothetical protein [Butyrivibrio sp.]
MKKALVFILALAMLAVLIPTLAEQTVDLDALRTQAIRAGMKLPDPGEGEKVYLGVSDVRFTKQTRLFLAFVAAPNNTSIRAAVLYGQAIEVPRTGQDSWLINNQLSLREDSWIPLDVSGPTDIIIDPDHYTAIAMLRIDGDEARCNVVLSGHYKDTSVGADSDWNITASVNLVNITGEAAIAPIDPPTRQQAMDAGMKLPEPEEGEVLYLGAANVSQAGSLIIAFVLSGDGQGLKDLTACARDLTVEYRLGSSKVTTTSGSCITSVNNTISVAEEIEAGSVHLSHLVFDGDGATGLLQYRYHIDGDDLDYPFDPAWVRFVRE